MVDDARGFSNEMPLVFQCRYIQGINSLDMVRTGEASVEQKTEHKKKSK